MTAGFSEACRRYVLGSGTRLRGEKSRQYSGEIYREWWGELHWFRFPRVLRGSA